MSRKGKKKAESFPEGGAGSRDWGWGELFVGDRPGLGVMRLLSQVFHRGMPVLLGALGPRPPGDRRRGASEFGSPSGLAGLLCVPTVFWGRCPERSGRGGLTLGEELGLVRGWTLVRCMGAELGWLGKSGERGGCVGGGIERRRVEGQLGEVVLRGAGPVSAVRLRRPGLPGHPP